MASTNFRRLSRLLVAILAPACAVFLSACEPECVDRYDCRDKTNADGEPFVCQDGRCVEAPDTGEEDAGEETDGGETDGGETDGGETDAGETDAGQTDGGQTDGGQTDGGLDGGNIVTFHARMTGEQFVPVSTETATAFGVFSFDQNPLGDGGHRLTYSITNNGIANGDIDQTHLHVAPAGVLATSTALTLAAVAGGNVNGTATISPALAADIAAGRVYADIHATQGGGSDIVRGQLIKPGERLFVARLNGAQAGNPLYLCTNAAFPTEGVTNYCGGVQVLLSPDSTELRYTGRWDTTLVATASHIHVGGLGASGGISVPLTLLADGGQGAEGGPTAATLDAGALDGGYYVNVHTADAGAGLIRGQLYER